MKDVVNLNSDVKIAGIRGPPGTGKTKILEMAFNDVLSGGLQGSDEKLTYLAPTNQLVVEFFTRVAALYASKANPSELWDFIRGARLYGSAMPIPYANQDEYKIRYIASYFGVGSDKVKRVLNDMVQGSVSNATYLFSTEYQRVSGRTRSPFKYLVLVDEASKTPFYLPFLPLADELLREVASGKSDSILGLCVVGDERQAIALEPEYHAMSGGDLLMLPMIEGVLRSINAHDRHFTTLTKTLRIPDPSQVPIGLGFYIDVGGLEASSTFHERAKAYGILNDLKGPVGFSSYDRMYDIISSAISYSLGEGQSTLIFQTRGPTWDQDLSLEPVRVKAAALSAVYFKQLLGDKVEVTITAPYRDLVYATKQLFFKKARSYNVSTEGVRFITVHSMIGGESDVLISILGKEFATASGYPNYTTIYFREPSLINVQFSRHRLFHVVVGDALRLANSAFGELKRLLGNEVPLRLLLRDVVNLMNGAKVYNDLGLVFENLQRSLSSEGCKYMDCGGLLRMFLTLSSMLALAGVSEDEIINNKLSGASSDYDEVFRLVKLASN